VQLSQLRRFRRKSGTTVTAVRLDLECTGFSYEKWGSTQYCKRGDWIVNNAGDTYSVDAQSFADTYQELRPGLYEKRGDVWARYADSDGSIATKEGRTAYAAGDVLVFNNPAGGDGYAMPAERFESLYEPAEG